jgi:hypothetical protein
MPNWTITNEPRGKIYDELVRVAVTRQAVGGLVVQNFRSWEPSFANFMGELAMHTIFVEATDEWPGTVLGRGNQGSESTERPKLHRFRLNEGVAHLLTTYASGLYDWLHPNLPEDLCFFDQSGAVWMTTISHERDAYFTLNSPELQNLLTAVPDLTGRWDEERDPG